MGANCHGFITADVLVKGLSRGAIVTVSLKGLNRTRGHGEFILVRPIDEGKSLRLVVIGIARISKARE